MLLLYRFHFLDVCRHFILYIIDMCFILLQTHVLESRPGEKVTLLYQLPLVRLESSEWTSVSCMFFHKEYSFFSLFTFFLAFPLPWEQLGFALRLYPRGTSLGTSLGSLTVAAPEVILRGILHPQSQAKI